MASLTVAQALALAVRQHQAGQLAQAEQLYRAILQADPHQAEVLHLLGVLSFQVGQYEQAAAAIGQALRLQPDFAEAHYHLGTVFQVQGRFDEARACYEKTLRLQPDHLNAHFNLGNVLRNLGQLDAALVSYQQTLRLQPDHAKAHNNRGVIFQAQGKLTEAQASYQRALRLQPDYAEAHLNLGNVLKSQGQLDEALACCQQALRLKPNLAEAHNNLGAVFQALRKLAEARASYQQALRLKPDYAEAHSNLGNLLSDPALPDPGRPEEVLEHYQQALRLKPDCAEAHNNLGNALSDQGRLEEALNCYRQALRLKPDYVGAHSNLVYALNFCPGYDATTIYEEHRRWNLQHAEPLAQHIQPHPNDRSPDRRLRVGYVSPDLRQHPVGRFLLPLLEAHDHTRFEVFCYSSLNVSDALTQRCRAHADVWRETFTVSDAQLAQLIRQDQIDVLVDLTMHMANNRLLVFARKPAPVQVTYLAYAGTTGLRTIDYRLTDPYLDPPGRDESHYSERSVRLPRTYWCYQPLSETPPVTALPAWPSGQVTFGCLNNFCKVTAPALAAWVHVLQELPRARLLLHARGGSHHDRVRALFADHGVAPERVSFVGHVPVAEYLRLYQGVDVALDPFPYGGGTTTCDALWMGVPVVSLAGQTAVGRSGLSILSNVGLADLVANDAAQYVRTAVALASDLPRLAELRAGLRLRMQGSPLMDAPRFARDVEAAYRRLWAHWVGPDGRDR
jgi:predicted O-linked N-acetylglucosamine transferase (SPINDLY family)